jgi:hypothetical protein
VVLESIGTMRKMLILRYLARQDINELNRQQGKKSNIVTQMTTSTINNNKPTHYSKKSYYATQSKQKLSNSLELLSGPIAEIQKKYILSDIVSGYNGRVFGSQSHISHNNELSIVVYFKVPEGKREEVKRKFENLIRNQLILQQQRN